MINSPEPEIHRQRERAAMEHIGRVLGDPKLRIDTRLGTRLAKGLKQTVSRSDQAVELKRLMSQLNLPDRELESRMPVGLSMEVVFARRKWLVFNKAVARLRVVGLSPTRELLKGEAIEPMTTRELQAAISAVPPSLPGVPMTLIVVSTSGFTIESRDLVDRRADRTLVLMAPNDAGGWDVFGPPELTGMMGLLDPEGESDKRARVRQAISEAEGELVSSGIPAEKIAGRTQLPVQLVEAELKSYAKSSGLVAKRLDGRMVVYREGLMPAALVSAGGSDMPLIDRIKSIFARKGENEKKIAFLSERRTALALQRDKAYEDLNAFEKQEGMLKRQFKEAAGAITKKRVTQQLLQMRKDVERRQQMIDVLNRQVNIVGTHLHNIELVQQGQRSELPDTEEITADAVAAEEMLASLEADAELAESVGMGSVGKMSEEEQALYEELERESGGAVAPVKEGGKTHGEGKREADVKTQATPGREGETMDQRSAGAPRRGEAEAG